SFHASPVVGYNLRGMKRVWIFAVCVFGTVAGVFAIEGTVTGTAVWQAEYEVGHWTSSSGLPQNTVQALLQTSDGYIWVGTWFGLARYDGIRFTVFNEDNTPEMRENPHGANVIALVEDAEGSLWLGTAGGLLRRKEHRFELFTTVDG